MILIILLLLSLKNTTNNLLFSESKNKKSKILYVGKFNQTIIDDAYNIQSIFHYLSDVYNIFPPQFNLYDTKFEDNLTLNFIYSCVLCISRDNEAMNVFDDNFILILHGICKEIDKIKIISILFESAYKIENFLSNNAEDLFLLTSNVIYQILKIQNHIHFDSLMIKIIFNRHLQQSDTISFNINTIQKKFLEIRFLKDIYQFIYIYNIEKYHTCYCINFNMTIMFLYLIDTYQFNFLLYKKFFMNFFDCSKELIKKLQILVLMYENIVKVSFCVLHVNENFFDISSCIFNNDINALLCNEQIYKKIKKLDDLFFLLLTQYDALINNEICYETFLNLFDAVFPEERIFKWDINIYNEILCNRNSFLGFYLEKNFIDKLEKLELFEHKILIYKY